MLRLKGQTESGEWMEFNISQVYDVCLYGNRWYVKGYPNDYIIDPSTTQPADDPRKAMLDEIQTRLKTLRWWPHFEDFKDWLWYHWQMLRKSCTNTRLRSSSTKWRPSCE